MQKFLSSDKLLTVFPVLFAAEVTTPAININYFGKKQLTAKFIREIVLVTL